jgi:hypothetical protein
LIESLRAFGYDLQTAIADIVDNSVYSGEKVSGLILSGMAATLPYVSEMMVAE